jgi:hypothetical protein
MKKTMKVASARETTGQTAPRQVICFSVGFAKILVVRIGGKLTTSAMGAGNCLAKEFQYTTHALLLLTTKSQTPANHNGLYDLQQETRTTDNSPRANSTKYRFRSFSFFYFHKILFLLILEVECSKSKERAECPIPGWH